MAHIYKELAHGEHDLKLFSSMNAHEDVPMYLISVAGGMQIIHNRNSGLAPEGQNIEAIGINGRIYRL